jgi:response regulator RpfG family c-di-GMP phosphodiesterase
MNTISDGQSPTPTIEENEKLSILYVDDEEDNLVVFKSTFRRDFKVFTAMSGEEGLAILEREDIFLVITDQRMPKMSGLQFLNKLPKEKDLIKIVLSGHTDLDAVLDAVNNFNVYRYILKPWNKNYLKLTLEKAVEESKQRQANKQLINELKAVNEQLLKKEEARQQQVTTDASALNNTNNNLFYTKTA